MSISGSDRAVMPCEDEELDLLADVEDEDSEEMDCAVSVDDAATEGMDLHAEMADVETRPPDKGVGSATPTF